MLGGHSTDFSNWIIYVTVKQADIKICRKGYFSNWIIYVTVKRGIGYAAADKDFSNWIIYVTVKQISHQFFDVFILVTE